MAVVGGYYAQRVSGLSVCPAVAEIFNAPVAGLQTILLNREA